MENVKRLVTGKLARPAGKADCSRFVRSVPPPSCFQRGGVASGRADLEIRHGDSSGLSSIAPLPPSSAASAIFGQSMAL